MNARRCEVTGCPRPACWAARKLWGGGGTIHTCDEHKPDPEKRPESLRRLPFFYEVKPWPGR